MTRTPKFFDIAEFIETEAAQYERIAARFWANVTVGRDDECWLWTGLTSSDGYGKMKLRHVDRGSLGMSAHRLAWMIAIGPIPTHLNVLHKCDVRCCVNPEHLLLETQGYNVADMNAKGRHASLPNNRNSAKLTPEQVRAIQAEADIHPISIARRREIAKTLGVHQTSIWNIASGRTWKPLSEGDRA